MIVFPSGVKFVNFKYIPPESPFVSDPYYSYTQMLFRGEGVNGANNTVFLDSSPSNFSIVPTAPGTTTSPPGATILTQGSDSPYSVADGYWSNFFNGRYIDVSASSSLDISTNDWTIECWAYSMDEYGYGDHAPSQGNYYLLNFGYSSFALYRTYQYGSLLYQCDIGDGKIGRAHV